MTKASQLLLTFLANAAWQVAVIAAVAERLFVAAAFDGRPLPAPALGRRACGRSGSTDCHLDRLRSRLRSDGAGSL